MRFPNWLFRQHERTDWIGKLARYARADRRLPVDPIDIYDRIRSTSGGDAEMLHALEAALEEWNGVTRTGWTATRRLRVRDGR